MFHELGKTTILFSLYYFDLKAFDKSYINSISESNWITCQITWTPMEKNIPLTNTKSRAMNRVMQQ